MAKSPLLLLGAMIATEAITFDQAKQWVEFCDESDAQHIAPTSLEVATDMALTYFRADPDTEAAKEAERVAEHCAAPHGTCCDCGAPLDQDEDVLEIDFEMGLDAWIMLRDMVRTRDAIIHEVDQEEC